MKIKLLYILFIIVFAILGFSRDFVFVNINNHLYNLYYQRQTHTLPESLLFLENFNYKTIYFGKYFLTITYFLVYFFATYFAVKLICNNKKFSQWIIYIYALLLLIAAVTMAYNYTFNHKFDGEEYTFSRWVMGITQSPLIAFFMIASYSLYSKINKSQTQ